MNILDFFVTYFMQNPIGQTIGFIALFVNIFAFITSKDQKFLIFMAISSAIWGIHFLYLWLLSAAFISFFDILKNIIALKYKKNTYIFWFLIISYTIIGIFTFQNENIFSIIPIINSILSVIFIYYLEWIRLKIGFLCILCFWLIYNFFGNSLGGMMSDIILIVSSFIGMYNVLKERRK